MSHRSFLANKVLLPAEAGRIARAGGGLAPYLRVLLIVTLLLTAWMGLCGA